MLDNEKLRNDSNGVLAAIQTLTRLQRKKEKICIFIDNLSLFHSVRANNLKPDYLKLQEFIAQGRTSDVRFYYTYHYGADPVLYDFLDSKAGFIMNGFEVDEEDRANVTCEIIYDMVRLATRYDKYVLVSGFTNYARTVNRLREDYGLRVDIAFFENQISSSLAIEADSIIDLANLPQVTY